MPNLLQKLVRPEFVFRPSQLWRRLTRSAHTALGDSYQEVRLPWGMPFRIHLRDSLGGHVWHTGIYDLVMSEVAWRLVLPGERILDVGGHMGYMTGLMAFRVGPGGRVSTFEPNPRMFSDLEHNVALWKGLPVAAIQLDPVALSDKTGASELLLPRDYATNTGLARIATGTPGADEQVIPIEVRRLDDVAASEAPIGLLKIDVEGHEPEVLRGARGLLERKAIRDVLFEDHGAYPTPAMKVLEDAGYTLFQVGRTFFGPRLHAPGAAVDLHGYPPCWLATSDPERARRLLAPAGWQVLRG